MNALGSRLLAALAYPRAVDDFVELALPLHSTREVRARVVSVRRETHDVATLRLQPNASWRGHRAGQHVALTVELRGVRRTRCFSIASADSESTIAITVKARPEGAVTPWLVSGVLEGAIVTLSQATGDFVLPDVLPERLLFVSGGSGITPVMAMLRSLVLRGHRGKIAFLHYAHSKDDVIFAAELDALARRASPNLMIQVCTGRFTAPALLALLPDFERWDTWACAPEPFLDALTGAFAARGAEDRVRVERFSLAPTDPSLGSGEVTFVRSRRRADGHGPLLGIAEKAGLAPASGCRRGICRTCTRKKISGVTRDLRTGQLSTDADVDIQLCVSAPVGPVAIDL
jgi:ferredoxin-NADP reductase